MLTTDPLRGSRASDPAHALAEIRDALVDIVDRLELLLPPEPGAEPKVRLTVDVPESLDTRIKVVCARNKLKMNTLACIARSNTTSGR